MGNLRLRDMRRLPPVQIPHRQMASGLEQKISFTKYQGLSMVSGRRQNRRKELCQILVEEEGRGVQGRKGVQEDFLRKCKKGGNFQNGLQQ